MVSPLRAAHHASAFLSATKYVNENDVRLVVIGNFYRGPFKGIDMNKVEIHDWVHVEAFPGRLASAGLDIVVVPLANPSLPGMKFNHYKSDIKWLEAAAFQVPAVVQGGVRAYETCEDGVNAMTFLSGDECVEAIRSLAADRGKRQRIGKAAYDYAFECRNLDKQIMDWVEFYSNVKKREDRATQLRPAGTAAAAEGS